MGATPSLPVSPVAALRATLPDALSRALVSAAELRGPSWRERRETLPTAVPPLDRLLRGGLPRGGLVEVVAPRSSGRFSLGLAALASATRDGEAAALVDVGDHLDPQAAAAAGVDLRRLLWVRPTAGVPHPEAGGCFGAAGTFSGDPRTPRTPRRPLSPARQALAATETLLTAGFALVVLDLGLRVPRGARQAAVWVRLSRAALVQDAALLVLSPARVTGNAAQAVLSAHAARALWSAVPVPAATPLLLGMWLRLTLEKRAGERPGASDAWRLRTRESAEVGAAPAPQLPEALPAAARRAAHG